MLKLLMLGLAGGLGTLARHALSTALRSPLGTLAVNLLGCLLMGAVMYLLRSQPSLTVLTVGFLGGFTTFSAFGYETLALLERGSALLALLNVAANVGLGTGAVWLGALLAGMAQGR